MEITTRTFPGRKFGPEQTETFAPLVAVLEAFAQEHGLELERTFDRDPLGLYAAYFLTRWSIELSRHCFMRISATNPRNFGTDFRIAASYKIGISQQWAYSSEEGTDRLVAILQEGKQFLEQAATASLRG